MHYLFRHVQMNKEFEFYKNYCGFPCIFSFMATVKSSIYQDKRQWWGCTVKTVSLLSSSVSGPMPNIVPSAGNRSGPHPASTQRERLPVVGGGPRLACSCHKPHPTPVLCSVPDSVGHIGSRYPHAPPTKKPGRARQSNARAAPFFCHKTQIRRWAVERWSAFCAHSTGFHRLRTARRPPTRTRFLQVLCFVLDVMVDGCAHAA